jgi:hypothetical protein
MAVTTRASKATAKALKEQYGRYMDQLNYGTEWVKKLKVSGEKYQGRKLVVPIRVKKIQPGAFMLETDALQTPVAAESTFLEFDITLYNARLATTWLAQEFDDGSVVKLSTDLEDWITSNNENLEYAAIFGKNVRGIICEMEGAVAPGVPIAINIAQVDNNGVGGFISAIFQADYDGDFTAFRALGSTAVDSTADESLNRYPNVLTTPAVATPATWVPVNLRCLDDLRLVEDGHGITKVAGGDSVKFYVVATNELASTITLVAASDVATASYHLTGLMPLGNGIGVELDTSIAVGALSFGNITCWTQYASKEMDGILQNLFFGTFGGTSRAAAGTAPLNPLASLRSRSFIQSVTPTGNRATITGDRILALLDIVRGRSGDKPKQLFANPLFNSVYVAAMTATFNMNVESSGGAPHKGDIVSVATRLAGYEIQEMRRLPRGMLLFVTPEHWKICTPKKGGGLGGVPMLRFRVQNKNRDSDTYAHTTTTIWGVFQQICMQPRANAVFSGISIVNELLD